MCPVLGFLPVSLLCGVQIENLLLAVELWPSSCFECRSFISSHVKQKQPNEYS